MRIFLLIFLSAFGLQAANYYVDFIGGSDANNGTSTTTPFQRCPGDANATGTAASTTLAAGDTVRFKGGITYIGQIQISVSGATNNLISYVGNFDNGWGAGDSIIDGDATYYHAFETTAGEDFIRIDGLSMRNQKNNLNYANAIVDRAGITITNTYAGSGLITDLGVIRAYQGSRWWWIQNCHIYELENWADRSVTNAEPDGVDATIEDVPCQQQTIYWYGSSGNPNYGLTVSNCTFRGVGTAGIFIYRASQSLIVSNDFGDVTQARTNRGWFSVAARVTDYCTNTVIVGNKTHNGWQYEGDDEYQRSHAGDWWHIYGSAQPPIDFTFAWNKAWNDEIFTSNQGTSDGIYISDGTLNFYLRSNIFANPHPLRVIYIGSGSCDYTYIEHNTILSESLSDGASTHIRIDSTHGPNLVIRNNASGVKDNLGLHIQDLRTSFAGTIDYNAYYSAANSTAWRNSGYVNFSTWQTWTGGEANSLVGALGLTSWPASAEDYIDLDATPAEGSALIGAASDGGDIGAIPFSDEPPPPPPLTIVTNNASGARVSGFRNLAMAVR